MRGGNNRKPRRELELVETVQASRMPVADQATEARLRWLIDVWQSVANLSVKSLDGNVAVESAGQWVRHPAVNTLESASKRIEALTILADRYSASEPANENLHELPDNAPPAWKPTEPA